MKYLIIIILLLGVVYRLYLTAGENFIFNMDNARDFVDIREMVVLHKLRLTGPSSAIEGVYNGPGWYYLLAVPFIFSGGDPYAAIIMEIILWVIGGYFLLKLSYRWGLIPLIFVSLTWVTSNFILLLTSYSFNPNPIPLLMPLFIFLLDKFLESKKLIYIILASFLGGLFFNFEMNYGVFIPIVIILSVALLNKKLIFSKNLWIGLSFFLITFVPQILFDLKHDYILTHSLLNYLTGSNSGANYNLLSRLVDIPTAFFGVAGATFSNFVLLTKSLILLWGLLVAWVLVSKRWEQDKVATIATLLVLVPFIIYLFIPVSVNSWHLGGAMTAGILLSGWVIKNLWNLPKVGKVLALILFFSWIIFSFNNVKNYLIDSKRENLDPANYKNEVAAIDYVYTKAQGKNFRVYTYMPSIMDYPYQYLFWWRGLTRYGYVPEDYAYLPGKPTYIVNKDLLPKGSNPEESGLVFLIKQPDEIKIRHLWENDFKSLKLISSEQVGADIVEIRSNVTP